MRTLVPIFDHFQVAWLPHAVCSLFWFNPLLWFARHKWHEEREMACDECVLQHIGLDNKQKYLESRLAEAAIQSGDVEAARFLLMVGAT